MGNGRTFQGIFSRLTDFPFSATVLTTGSWKAFAGKVCGKNADPPATAADIMNFLREKALDMVESPPPKRLSADIVYDVRAPASCAKKVL